ncbi:MAG TPA: DUF3418 domain-containing protein, partial [Candidatus Sulfotelmatobacter sp.]|nr:DUF3418 domain-containing protein [Candidatus Sulfotelmatobacter sp.]
YDRAEKKKAKVPPKSGERPGEPKKESTHQPPWIVAGEIVETSQLFARTVAGIDPLWIVQLAPHLCKVTYHNPHWSAVAGRVLAEEKVTLYGLDVHQRKVAYGNIQPKEATQIFIRSALVEGDLFPEPPRSAREERHASAPTSRSLLESVSEEKPKRPALYQFLEHNDQIRQKIETWQTRMRRHDLADLDQALCDFYAKRIENVSSLHELNRLLRDQADPNLLCATEADLIGGQNLSYDAEAFPDNVPLGGQPVALSYAYAPGEERDGVTFKLGFSLAQSLPGASLEWAVPGLREAQVSEMLRSLPKTIRRQLMPFPPKVAEIVRDLRPSGESLQLDLGKFIQQRYGVEVPPSAWPADALPPHLRPRIEVLGHDQKTISTGRDLAQLQRQFAQAQVKPAAAPAGEDPAWARVTQQWERFGLTGWTCGDLPERVIVKEGGDVPLYAWPGLQVEEGQVHLRLFRSQAEARRVSLGGIQRLVELAIQKDLAWLQKDLRALSRLEPLLGTFCSMDELQA